MTAVALRRGRVPASVMGTCTWTLHRHRNTGESANVTSGKRLMRSLSSGSIALVLATLTTEAWAQSGAENALESHALGSMPLSAAIADMRRSPFYTSESLVSLGSSMAGHLWAPLAVDSPGSSIRWAANDSTFPGRRVFLVALGSSALTLYLGTAIAIASEISDGGGSAALTLGGLALPVFAVAGGAKLAGARFGPALAGSALGSAAAVAVWLGVGGEPGLWLGLVGPPIHALVTTATASHFN